MRQLALRILQARTSTQQGDRRKFRWLPWAISLIAVGYVVYRLSKEDASVWQAFWPPDLAMITGIACSLLLLPLNWWLESEKWRLLLRPWYPSLSAWKSLQAVLVGLSTGIFTPNRIGEYPGRIMTLPAGYRWEAATVMLLDRLVQMVVTCWAGIFALWVVQPVLPAVWQEPASRWLPGITVFALLIPLITWPVARWLVRLLPQHSWGSKLRTAICQTPFSRLLQVLGLAILRNAVFSAQFFILLLATGMEAPLQLAIPLIWTIFLLKSLVPAWTITELGIRETIAITVLGFAGISAATAFSATFLLYLVNLILPALLGLRWVNRLSLT